MTDDFFGPNSGRSNKLAQFVGTTMQRLLKKILEIFKFLLNKSIIFLTEEDVVNQQCGLQEESIANYVPQSVRVF